MNGLSLMGCTHACNFSAYQGNPTSCLGTLPAESHKKAKHVPNQPLFFFLLMCSSFSCHPHSSRLRSNRPAHYPPSNFPGPYFLSGDNKKRLFDSTARTSGSRPGPATRKKKQKKTHNHLVVIDEPAAPLPVNPVCSSSARTSKVQLEAAEMLMCFDWHPAT